jgi:hypothetical protein
MARQTPKIKTGRRKESTRGSGPLPHFSQRDKGASFSTSTVAPSKTGEVSGGVFPSDSGEVNGKTDSFSCSISFTLSFIDFLSFEKKKEGMPPFSPYL